MSWYLSVIKKYATFSGRARRKEYWMFYLFNMIIAVVLNVLLISMMRSSAVGIVYGIIVIYSLALIIPGIAVFVRRLHDINKSGAWFFIAFIPIIGSIWLLVLMCTEGTRGPNTYGDDPKALG